MEPKTRQTVEIDVTAATVTLRGERSKAFGGQWVSFYALLALRAEVADDGRFLTAEELGRVGRWQHKGGKSVGKEVARHLATVARAGFPDLLAHEGKTLRWRLHRASVTFLPDKASVAGWLHDRRAAPGIPELGPLADLVQATLDLNAGRTEEAMELALGIATEGPYDSAWRAVVAGRAAQRTDEGERLPGLLHELERGSDAATRAARARLSTLIVYNRRFVEPPERLDELRALAGRLEAEGDVGSLAGTCRRSKRPCSTSRSAASTCWASTSKRQMAAPWT